MGLWVLSALALFGLWASVASPDQRQVLASTFQLSLAAGLGSAALGGLLAYALWGGHWMQRGLLLGVAAAAIMPPFLHLSVWDAAIGKLGWVTSGGDNLFRPLVSKWLAAIWVHSVAAAPAAALVIYGYLSTSSRTIEERLLLEMSPFQVFRRVTLRRLVPVLMLTAVWGALVAFREIAVTDLYQIGTLAEQVYLGYALDPSGRMAASAGGNGWWTPAALQWWIIVWVAASLVGLVATVWRREYWARDLTPLPALPSASRRQLAAALTCSLLFVALPVGNLVARASMQISLVDGIPQRRFGLENLVAALFRAAREFSDSMLWSSLIALAAGSIALVLAVVMVGWAIGSNATGSRTARIGLVVSVIALLAVPGPVLGAWLATLLNHPWPDWLDGLLGRSLLLPVAANILFAWPWVALLVVAACRSIPIEMTEMGDVYGISRWRQIGLFVVRGHWPLLVAVGMVTFAYMFGELSASHAVLPPGVDTVPRRMLGLMHAGVDEMTAAMSLVLLAGLLAVVVAAQALVRLNRWGPMR